MFDLLCLGYGHGNILLDYHIRQTNMANKDNTSDIEKILESILKDHELINMPERQKSFWKMYYDQNINEEQLRFINKYRNKFGLTTISYDQYKNN